MLTFDDTTTHPNQDNDDDKILILDGKQRMEYFANLNPPLKRKGLLGVSMSEVLKKLRS